MVHFHYTGTRVQLAVGNVPNQATLDFTDTINPIKPTAGAAMGNITLHLRSSDK